MKNLSLALYELQSKTIGLFKHRSSDIVDLVIENNEGSLHTVHIGTLGGLSEMHGIPSTHGLYKEFGDSKTLEDMMKTPLKLQEFYVDFKK